MVVSGMDILNTMICTDIIATVLPLVSLAVQHITTRLVVLTMMLWQSTVMGKKTVIVITIIIIVVVVVVVVGIICI